MADYPLYVYPYGKIEKLLEKIKTASVPPKFNIDFLKSVLMMKSSADTAFIRLLKRIGFISPTNEPTELYKKFRDAKLSKSVMAEAIKIAYPEFFEANEYVYTLSREEFSELTKRITGLASDHKLVGSITETFFALKEFADFGSTTDIGKIETEKNSKGVSEKDVTRIQSHNKRLELGISYTINLNLPATTNIEVFNAIFKSLKENLLKDD